MRTLPALLLLVALESAAGAAPADHADEPYVGALAPELRRLRGRLLSSRPLPVRAPGSLLAYAVDMPPALRAQLDGDLRLLGALHGTEASPLHRAVFGPIDGAGYLRWFGERVQDVDARSCGPSFATACVDPSLGAHTLSVSPSASAFDMPQIVRVSVLLHEARHTEAEKGYWDHAPCPAGDLQTGAPIKGKFSGAALAGFASCDDAALGGYGVALVFLKNVEKRCDSPACNGKVRMDAGLYGDDLLHRIVGADAERALTEDTGR